MVQKCIPNSVYTTIHTHPSLHEHRMVYVVEGYYVLLTTNEMNLYI